MPVGLNYSKAKRVVAETLGISPRQADEWLITHAGLRIEGNGYHKMVYFSEQAAEAVAKITGPYGAALVRATDINHG